MTGPYEGVKSAVHLIVEKVRIAIAKGQMPLALTNPPPPAAQIETVYRILMPDYRVGGLIGKGGEVGGNASDAAGAL